VCYQRPDHLQFNSTDSKSLLADLLDRRLCYSEQDLNNLQDYERKQMSDDLFQSGKCEVLMVTAKRKNIMKAVYTIHGISLNTVSSAKYRGVTIDTKLNYNEHINNICKKANSTWAFTHCNTRSYHRNVKATAYTSFVRPQLEYASTVWGPHTANYINQINQLIS